ncbi:hypothetical protein CEXT_488251 [Caerostris extrusa]|uniref:Uncharacterized protein n=1 Tax=Caerostris extrusa TaxID=172846 RepID=A0AAV4XEI0_CAEEX|nr:hypothetical protein CEXT_488251 [Caerostris extrusa]
MRSVLSYVCRSLLYSQEKTKKRVKVPRCLQHQMLFLCDSNQMLHMFTNMQLRPIFATIYFLEPQATSLNTSPSGSNGTFICHQGQYHKKNLPHLSTQTTECCQNITINIHPTRPLHPCLPIHDNPFQTPENLPHG